MNYPYRYNTNPLRFVVFVLLVSALSAFSTLASAQTKESEATPSIESTRLGGYGEIGYNNTDSGSTLNIPRLVVFLSHQFSQRWSFKSELELENVKVEGSKPGGEFEVEQAFLDYQLGEHFGFRGGLMLIPSGIINQTHEPTTFMSVGRPHLDQQVIPTTWRQIGFAAHGELGEMVQFQAMIGEGMTAAGYNQTGIYEGRQDGANARVMSPSVSAKVEILPTLGLRIGASLYYQSNTAGSLAITDSITQTPQLIKSSLTVLAIDARYDIGSLHLRGEFATDAIGSSTSLSTVLGRPIPTSVNGAYAEASFNLVPLFSQSSETELLPFVRYETLHHTFDHNFSNDQDLSFVMVGLAVKPVAGVIVKANYEVASKATYAVTEHEFMTKQLFSLGLGYQF